MILPSFQNFMNNMSDKGSNPRAFEVIYRERIGTNYLKYNKVPAIITSLGLGLDTVTSEPIIYDTRGYVDILKNKPEFKKINDPSLSTLYDLSIGPDFIDTVLYSKDIGSDLTERNLKSKIERYGILYAQYKESSEKITDISLEQIAFWIAGGHAVAIVGYRETENYFSLWVHDSQNTSNITMFHHAGPEHFRSIYYFYDPQWPTFHHDNRRTGFTLLKGQIEDEDDIHEIDYVMQGDGAENVVSVTAIADIDDDEKQEVIVTLSKTGEDANGWLHVISNYENWRGKKKFKEPWGSEIEIGEKILGAPSIGNLDTDDELEIVIGLKNGSVIAFDDDSDILWQYQVRPKHSTIHGGDTTGEVAYAAIADVDLDGTTEVIFTDSPDTSLTDWQGTLYIVSGNTGELEDAHNFTMGAYNAPSIANLDSDDYFEIVVPGNLGVRIFKYNGQTITEKKHFEHRYIDSSVVVYDIDRDNKYELIYATSEEPCPLSPCYSRLYVVDAVTETVEDDYPIDLGHNLVRSTPAVADVDKDEKPEVIMTSRFSTVANDFFGNILCYNYDTYSECNNWPYNKCGILSTSRTAPNVADLDGDGDNDIVIVEGGESLTSGRSVVILDGRTAQVDNDIFLGGLLGSAPAIGDIYQKGVADLAVKRAGSPLAILSVVTLTNEVPELEVPTYLSGKEGDLLNINATGEIQARDNNNDSITINYGSPFNESGLWDSHVNHSGNYTVVIDVSDGNLSSYEYVEMFVFPENSTNLSTFNDTTSMKSLSFTGQQSQSVHIRLPKNASMYFARMKIEGGST